MESNPINQVKESQRFEQNCDEFGVFAGECRNTEDARRWEESWKEYSVGERRGSNEQIDSAVIKAYEAELARLLSTSLSADELKIGLTNFIGLHMPNLSVSKSSINR